MPRPRIHDLDAVLDAAEALAVESGAAAVTIRAVATATGMSNGALYHSFHSRSELLARTWIRAAQRFLDLQAELVDASAGDGIEAVVAAAEAPVAFARRFPASTKLMFLGRRDELLGTDLPAGLTADLAATDRRLIGMLKRLSLALWDRKDAAALDTLTTCVVDLPTAILLDRDRLTNPTARAHLRAAVRAVLEVGPPPQ
ncbi:TetR/AcrR family transcriptional regulator [Nocardia huaxiensis]|uniref:TetR family transcriptional regulator n=1 Tax=Nocardia huaxiensis TaxID=2755382 RepID=A0A7D6Z1L6_9NOCA|nr:TetR/AcrR family transcriptional regulator [Nocardia huaxiensis]QLY28404.1 TetR family transcriptional regulator [Nocardia huaxiensis]UFS98143.1 TetR family transcriptional regulator [Nocardia huaxiensis]